MANRDSIKSAGGALASYQLVRAARGAALSCRAWQQEAALRMLMNTLDPDVAERPQDLSVQGGRAQATRDWNSYQAIAATLKKLANDETLLVQSGETAGVFHTNASASRVLLVNPHPPGNEATGRKFDEDDRLGLTLFGRMAASSWMHIGAQDILQVIYETFAAAAQKHFGGDLAGKLIVSGGMGGMGGAQALAATMIGSAFLGIEVDGERIKRRIRSGYCNICVNSLDEAVRILKNAVRKRQGVSVGIVGNCAEIVPELARRGILPDLLTDQTSAHDPLNGYLPAGLSLDAAAELRLASPEEYLKHSYDSIARHVTAMLELQKLGAATFEFGNNIRAEAFEHGGVKEAYNFPGFVSAYLRPLLDVGREPVRWVALSGEPADIHRIDDLVLELFPDNPILNRWIRMARKFVKFQGLPARIGWLDRRERAQFGERVNDLVARGELKAPIAIGCDHLDPGSVSSAFGEIEHINDGSDAAADRPRLDKLLTAASGASWASFNPIGDGSAGHSLHAAQVIVADGTPELAERLNRVLASDPGRDEARRAKRD